jgi:hypothetical protein
MKKQIVSYLFLLLVGSAALNSANAAPVTLQFITTSTSTGQTAYFDESCTVIPTPCVKATTGTSAGVVASFVLSDATLLNRSNLNFTYSSQYYGVPAFLPLWTELIAASIAFQAPRLGASGFGSAGQDCNIATTPFNQNPTRCLVNVALTRDPGNINRFSGSLTMASVFRPGDKVAVDTSSLSWSQQSPFYSNTLPLGGYWEVVGSSANVPVPASGLLLLLGMLLLGACIQTKRNVW